MQEALESYSTIGCLQWRWFGISDEAFQLMTCKLFPFLAISSDTEKNNCVPVCPSRTYKHSQVSTFHTLTVMSWDPLTLRKEYIDESWCAFDQLWTTMIGQFSSTLSPKLCMAMLTTYRCVELKRKHETHPWWPRRTPVQVNFTISQICNRAMNKEILEVECHGGPKSLKWETPTQTFQIKSYHNCCVPWATHYLFVVKLWTTNPSL